MLLLYRVGCLYRVVAGGEIPECVWLVSVWGWTYLLDAGQGRRRVCTLQINGLKPLLLLLIASKWRMSHTDLGFFGCVEYFNFIMSPNFEKRLEMSQLLTPIFKMKNGWVKTFLSGLLSFSLKVQIFVMSDSVHQIFLFLSCDRFCMDQGIWLKALKCFQCSQSQYILILDWDSRIFDKSIWYLVTHVIV